MDCTTTTAKSQVLDLGDLAMMDKPLLTPEEACVILGCQPQALRKMAATAEGRQGLCFPVCRIGTRTTIPRIPFLRAMGWEGSIKGAKEAMA